MNWVLNCIFASAIFPGGYPTDYKVDELVPITVDKISSSQSPITYDLSYIKQCPLPEGFDKENKQPRMNLGQVLKGDSTAFAPYEVRMKKDVGCTLVCDVSWSRLDKRRMLDLINMGYMVSLSADDLPGGVSFSNIDDDDSMTRIVAGYPLGDIGDDKLHITNYLKFKLSYHETKDGEYRVVGFEIKPGSISSCEATNELFTVSADSKKSNDVSYYYSVTWEPSDIAWATRWDLYLKPREGETEIHWFSLLDSILIVMVLAVSCSVVLCRTVLQDISRYNDLDEPDELEFESGWKLLHADVFRRPYASRLLAAFLGSGVQVAWMAGAVIIGMACGVLSPVNRGSIGQAVVVLFSLFGVPAGYSAAKFNRIFLQSETSNARSLVITGATALLFPGVVFCGYLFTSAIIWAAGGASPPFTTVLLLGFLWFGVSVPLTVGGAYLGYKAEMADLPCRLNKLPRQIPNCKFWQKGMFLGLAAGIPILSVGVTEMRSLMISLVVHNFYYLFGFIILSFILMVVSAMLFSIITTYMTLIKENWKWWWPAWTCGASTGLYSAMLGLSLINEFSSKGLGILIINMTHILIASLSLSLLLGSMCLLASLWFVKSIYSSIRLD